MGSVPIIPIIHNFRLYSKEQLSTLKQIKAPELLQVPLMTNQILLAVFCEIFDCANHL